VIFACLLPGAQTATAASLAPCGTEATVPATMQHVVWIVFENQDYDSIIGSPSAPFTNLLADQCGLATNFFAETHPSLPNYIAMTSGSTQGITDDSDPSAHPLDVPNIFAQLGSDWRALQESMPSNCLRSDSGLYAARHNPAAYYTNIDCAAGDVPLGAVPDISAAFTFVTPNLCNDTHDCPVQTGDAWLSTFMAQVLASPEYQAGRTAVFITWDESNDDSLHIPTLVVSPYTEAGIESDASYDHYSLLRTTEELLGLDTLGAAATAPSMRTDFFSPARQEQMRVALVPAYRPCTNPNTTHGAPLAFPSCSPPLQTSGNLTVGTPASNDRGANSTGAVHLYALRGSATQPDGPDIAIRASVGDVRRSADLLDYTGELQAVLNIRLTELGNGSSGEEAQTVQDFRLRMTVPCEATADVTVGARCSLTTTANTVVPGSVEGTGQSLWQLGQVQVYDGGMDGTASTLGDNRLFETQGVFVP
jgi:hypothetical protein